MLRDFVEKKHYNFEQRADSWEEAIRLACKPLVADHTVDDKYAEEIIKCVYKYGPYIVLIPGVAMPHSGEGVKGVYKTAVSFMKLNEAVKFDEGDPDKDAVLFFTLASCNHEEHLKNMSVLSEMLMNEKLLEELKMTKSAEDLLRLQEMYLD